MTGLTPAFDRSVFINCPFDPDFAPILQAVAFCVAELGFYPRLAPESADNATSRLDRIVKLIKTSKYAIHDLSRSKATAPGEYYRMNMPFELGIDHGCRKFGAKKLRSKSILILERERYDYQKALSDIAGWDIHTHGGDYIEAVRHVSTWLKRQAGAKGVGATRIISQYYTFQAWYWKREQESGASEDDIKAYPTIRVVDAMQEWVNLGRPVG